MKEHKFKTRLLLLFTLIVFTFVWAIYTYLDYSLEKNQILENIDLRLYNSAVALKFILPDDFHDRAINEQAIPIEEDKAIANKFNKLVDETGIKYAYTIIKKGEKLFFVASVVVVAPETKRGTYYFYEYKEADKSFMRHLIALHQHIKQYRTNGVMFEQL